MSVAATSQVAIAKHALRALVAASTTFQSVVGAANATEALSHVHLGEADDRENETFPGTLIHPRPRAIIAQQSFSLTQTGERIEQFGLVLSFEFPPPSSVVGVGRGVNITDETTWFDNQWGAIVNEMATATYLGSATYFSLTSMEVIDGPMNNDPDQDPVNEYYWGVALTVMGPHP